ncbi:hypothetical protein CEXT_528851 [Caerostris extrusa]|uniref:Uncharacterized protein n=1 Tax=Caerostris extrusa TaxID=172846 RepID=A0AAV4VZJ8_CAEEX|nr:hypothetical protein CEXT_528851 [Caerostris extrusa]
MKENNDGTRSYRNRRQKRSQAFLRGRHMSVPFNSKADPLFPLLQVPPNLSDCDPQSITLITPQCPTSIQDILNPQNPLYRVSSITMWTKADRLVNRNMISP